MAQTTAQGSYAERARKAIPSSVNNLNLRSSSDLATQALDIVANVWSQPQPTAPPHHLSVSSAEDQWPEVGSHHEPQPTTITRKTVEKTSKSKWVPIPAHELQAAADALNPARRPKSSRPHSNSNSGSRKQTPGASSSAHSRTHSRATSVHSSPIFPRGRRLPDDPHSSPPLIVQPHLAPPPQPISIYHDPFAVRYYQPQWYNNPSPPLHSPVYLPHPTVYHHPPYDPHPHPQDLTQPQPSTSPLPLPPTLNTVNVSSIISSSTSTSRVFGSIEPSTAPYRPPLPSTTTAPCAFPQFSIGVPVGSTSIPSARNRTRRKPKPSWEGKNPDDENRENGHDEERELVDLTPRWSDAPPHTNKWVFGSFTDNTNVHRQQEEDAAPWVVVSHRRVQKSNPEPVLPSRTTTPPQPNPSVPASNASLSASVPSLSPLSLSTSPSHLSLPIHSPSATTASSSIPTQSQPSQPQPQTHPQSSPRQLQRLLEHLATSTQEHEVEEEMVHQAEEDHPNGPPHNIHPNPTAHPDDADHVFEVKDYGCGFGSGGPSSLRPYGYAPPQTEAYSYGAVNANGAGGSGYVSPTWERERGEYNGNGNGNGRHSKRNGEARREYHSHHPNNSNHHNDFTNHPNAPPNPNPNSNYPTPPPHHINTNTNRPTHHHNHTQLHNQNQSYHPPIRSPRRTRGGYASSHRRNTSGGFPSHSHQPSYTHSSQHHRGYNNFDSRQAHGGYYPPMPLMRHGVNGHGIGGQGMGGMQMGMGGVNMNGGMYYDHHAPPGMGFDSGGGTGGERGAAAAAPMPAPVTQLTFPLDTTRWYLLGQLEYYLSAQNMAQDYFLRQWLDSQGYVPIALIASFNRVRRLTEDPGLVREVLTLSSVVEVSGEWVRMKDWRAFVLPGARVSVVQVQQQGEGGGHGGGGTGGNGYGGGGDAWYGHERHWQGEGQGGDGEEGHGGRGGREDNGHGEGGHGEGAGYGWEEGHGHAEGQRSLDLGREEESGQEDGDTDASVYEDEEEDDDDDEVVFVLTREDERWER